MDAFAGGRVSLVQPDDGHHRSGLEASILGAALDADFTGTVVDLGAGTGAAGLTIAARCAGARVTLVDRDRRVLDYARTTLTLPANAAFSHRVRILEADVTGDESDRTASGLARASVDTVIANPPFLERQRASVSPHPDRSSAHVLGPAGLEPWIRCAASVLRTGGQLIVIVAVDLLPPLQDSLANRFGGIHLLPLHPRATMPASRLLVRAVKDSRTPPTFNPPLVLHGTQGSDYLPELDSVLRGHAALSDVHPTWGKLS
ncbi:MAG: tRNA1(Val) (adenine(37)-N6)-methyltransferase [Alphaproteobacteria bacterium]